MNLQYISDSKGHHTGVFIPIEDWEKIKKQLDKSGIINDVQEPSKDYILKGLEDALEEVKKYEKGAARLNSARDLLDENPGGIFINSYLFRVSNIKNPCKYFVYRGFKDDACDPGGIRICPL